MTQLLFPFAQPGANAKHLSRRRKRPLPPRDRWPRAKQPAEARRPCPHCGHLDRAVSSREQITYYGPAKCEQCGTLRNLRKVERPPDWELIRELYVVDNS